MNNVDLSYCPHRIQEPLIKSLTQHPEQSVYTNLERGRAKLNEAYTEKIQGIIDKHGPAIQAIIKNGGSPTSVAKALGIPRASSETAVKILCPDFVGPKTKQIQARQRIREKHGVWILSEIAAGRTQKSVGEELGIGEQYMSKIVKELRSE